MAGKPETPHIQNQPQPQQQPPSVQNVVVYVSNDNFTYAVNHQNVAAFQHQAQQNIREPGVFNNSSQSVASLVVPGKAVCKPCLKTQEFPNNGIVGSVSEPRTSGFYAPSASDISHTNGFHHCHSPNVINNLMYSNSAGHGGTVLNPNFSETSLKNIVNLEGQTIGQQQAVCPTIGTPSMLGVNGELCSNYAINQQPQNPSQVSVSCAQPFFSDREQKTSVSHSDASSSTVSLSANNFLTSQSGDGNLVTVMGGDGSGTPVSSGSVVFPRCDSVRSEAAESSCSSLSSVDSQPDAGSVPLLLQSTGNGSPQAAASTSAPANQHQFTANGSNIVHQRSGGASINNGVMMLNNSVNIQPTNQQAAGIVRTPNGAISLSQQQIGNVVLAMTVNNNQQLSTSVVSTSSVNQQPITSAVHVPTVPTPTAISVPLGWKRLNVGGSIVYIRDGASAAGKTAPGAALVLASPPRLAAARMRKPRKRRQRWRNYPARTPWFDRFLARLRPQRLGRK